MVILAVMACVIVAFITMCGLLAHVQRTYRSIAEESYRQDLGMSCLCALVPVAWILVPFVTGFYQHGFMLPWRPDWKGKP